MENYELSSGDIKQIDWVTSQVKDGLNGIKSVVEQTTPTETSKETSTETDTPTETPKETPTETTLEATKETGDSFYEINNEKVILKMDIVKNYLEKIKDKERSDLKASNAAARIMAVQIAIRSPQIGGGNKDKYGDIIIDGVLGPKTKEAVEKFQTEYGLKKVDGLPGKETMNKIYDILTGKVQAGAGEQKQSDPENSDADSGNNSNKNDVANNGETGNGVQKVEKSENNESEPETKEKSDVNSEKLKSFFEKNATNLSVDKIDGKDFFEVSYTDKNSGSKVKGIIPVKWNGNSNIYMPGDRSGIEETMKQKQFEENITSKNSKKAWFIFEGDSNKIKNGTQQSARYNNLINNFENMVSPMKLAGDNPKINIIGHSRAGATVNSLIGKYSSISNYIILDGTYGVYKNVMQSNIPGKIFYTNGGGTKKYISNYQNKPNLEVIGDYANLGHEAIVPKVLFDDSRTQDLFA